MSTYVALILTFLPFLAPFRLVIAKIDFSRLPIVAYPLPVVVFARRGRSEDLVLDEKFTIKTDDEQVVASVTQAMKEEELVPDLEEEALEGEEGETVPSDEAGSGEDSQSDEKKEEASEKEEKNTEESKN